MGDYYLNQNNSPKPKPVTIAIKAITFHALGAQV